MMFGAIAEWPVVPVLAGILGGAALLFLVLDRRLRSRRAQRRLHRRLAAANGLSAEERSLLWRLATSVPCADPTLVWVQPSLLAAGAAALDVDVGQVQVLHQKLFSR